MTDIIASARGPKIETGATVTLHFSLLFTSGEEIDTTRNGDPATFVVGDGNLLPGFEEVLMGREAGFADQIRLAPEDAFGAHNPANVQTIARSRFSTLDELEEGLIISFQAPDGELPGVVLELYEDAVRVDFNHPLSGKEIIFDVSVLSVEPPSGK